jgi:hypothetical protein
VINAVSNGLLSPVIATAGASDLQKHRLIPVGVAGFEPTTSSSRTKRATKLRHTPVNERSLGEGAGLDQTRRHGRAGTRPPERTRSPRTTLAQ